MTTKHLLAATLVACSLGTQAQVIQTFQVRDAVTLRTPVLTDSVNTEGRRYETKDLLNTAIGLNQDNYTTQAMEADTAGLVTLAAPDGEDLIYVVSTNIRADRFMKGNLKVTSPVRWEAFIDGASKSKKENADDSLNVKAAQDIALCMEPERDYVVTLKFLAHKDDKVAPAFKCEVVADKGYEKVNVYSGHDLKRRFTLDNTVYGNRVIDVLLLKCDRIHSITFFSQSHSVASAYESESYYKNTFISTKRHVNHTPSPQALYRDCQGHQRRMADSLTPPRHRLSLRLSRSLKSRAPLLFCGHYDPTECRQVDETRLDIQQCHPREQSP